MIQGCLGMILAYFTEKKFLCIYIDYKYLCICLDLDCYLNCIYLFYYYYLQIIDYFCGYGFNVYDVYDSWEAQNSDFPYESQKFSKIYKLLLRGEVW